MVEDNEYPRFSSVPLPMSYICHRIFWDLIFFRNGLERERERARKHYPGIDTSEDGTVKTVPLLFMVGS